MRQRGLCHWPGAGELDEAVEALLAQQLGRHHQMPLHALGAELHTLGRVAGGVVAGALLDHLLLDLAQDIGTPSGGLGIGDLNSTLVPSTADMVLASSAP